MQTAEVVPDAPANVAQDPESWACPTGAGAVPVGADSLADPATCLIWQATSPGAHSNREATLFCETLEQDGFADWRVPRPEELASHPSLAPASNAYITNPVYLRGEAQDPATGCAADAHSCNLSHYSQGNLGCAWQGVGFRGPLLCVRGDALVDSLPLAFAATNCTPCSAPVGSNFNVADCRTP